MKTFIKLTLCAASLLMASPALAHVVRQPGAAAPGQIVEAQVIIGHGCSGKPATALTLAIPEGVGMIHVMETTGWTAKTEQKAGRTVSINWTLNDPKSAKADDKPAFSLHMEMPKAKGRFFFPATEVCGTDVVQWAEQAADGAPAPKNPAPSINVGGAAAPAMSMDHAGGDHAGQAH